jgi:hypothetical protein
MFQSAIYLLGAPPAFSLQPEVAAKAQSPTALPTQSGSMPDYSQDTYKQTKDRLTKSGAEIGSFNQGTFRKDLAFPVIATIGAASLEGGYCNGVLLDWVRRVLLSRAERDKAFLTFHSGALAEGEKTVKRTHEELKGRASQTVQRMGHAWYRSGDMDWVGQVNEPTTAVSQEEWERTASAIDEEFGKQRKGAKREPSKKHFGRLELKASRKTTYKNASQRRFALTPTCVPYPMLLPVPQSDPL